MNTSGPEFPSEINFHSEIIDFKLSDDSKYKDWIIRLAEKHKVQLSVINYIFCDDEYLLEINKTYLDHDYYTDIITFPLNQDPIEADIFISIDRVYDNATQLKVAKETELHRVMAHGILHLIGFKDKTEEDALEMRNQEEEAIAMILSN